MGEYKELKALKGWQKTNQNVVITGMVVNKVRELKKNADRFYMMNYFFYYAIKNKDLFAYSGELTKYLIWP